MGFRINTNVAAMNSHAYAGINNRELTNALTQLGSGLRINSAADDGSGLAIANTLRTQANTLGMGIKNANDAVGIIQIADKAMDEQVKILDTIKTKATQAASDGQTADSRAAIQKDISKLLKSLDSIAESTSFNGKSLLDGSFSNKSFQVGLGKGASVDLSINSTSSSKIGQTRIETSNQITKSGTAQLNINDISLQAVKIGTGTGEGIGELAKVINSNSDRTGVKASFEVKSTGIEAISAGDVKGLTINGMNIGDVTVQNTDNDGQLVSAINAKSLETGVEASLEDGKLLLSSTDGRGIEISADSGLRDVMKMGNAGGNKNTHIGGALTGASDRELTSFSVGAGAASIESLKINGVAVIESTSPLILAASATTTNTQAIVNAINTKTDLTGVSAYTGGSGANASLAITATTAAAAGTSQVDTFSLKVDIDATTNLVEKGDTFSFNIDGVDIEYMTTGEEKSAREVVDNIVNLINGAMGEGIFDKGSTHELATNRIASAGGLDASLKIHNDNDARMVAGNATTSSTSSQTSASFTLTQVESLGSAIFTSSTVTNLSNTTIVFEAADSRGSTITIESADTADVWGAAAGNTNELAITEGIRIKTDDDGGAEILTINTAALDTVNDFSINGVVIGDFLTTKTNTQDLVDRINAKSKESGVEATLVSSTNGSFKLSRTDGSNEGIVLGSNDLDADTSLNTVLTIATGQIDNDAVKMIKLGDASAKEQNYGTISLSSSGGQDIKVKAVGSEAGTGRGSISNAFSDGAMTQKTTTLAEAVNGVGVTTKEGAMSLMDVVDSAIKLLDSIRADLGSTQNQLSSTVNNLSITQVNVKSAESQIRDVDFAAESATFQKHNLLAQSGSYAMSQANQTQQNVMSLLR